MDKMVDHLFVFQGEGRIKDITGNYHSYRSSLQQSQREQKQAPKTEVVVEPSSTPEKKRKMSFKEKQEFEQIEQELPKLELEKDQLSEELSMGTLSNEELMQKGERLGAIVAQIDEYTFRWLELSELA
jgi:ATP-binding cassette subfamily F protein uup